MNERADSRVAFSHISVLAAFSVVALVAVAFFQLHQLLSKPTVVAGNGPNAEAAQAETPFSSIDWQAPNPDAAGGPADADGISNIGANVVSALFGTYASMQEDGAFTLADFEQVAADIGASLKANVSHTTYTAADVKTDRDTSYERMLKYRDDMRVALEPLLKNSGYELKIFSTYLETKDRKYIAQLDDTTENYLAAVKNALTVTVPTDALDEHLAAVNSLSAFAALLSQISLHADDPFATAALLRTYTSAENDLVVSFDSLATYQKNKTP